MAKSHKTCMEQAEIIDTSGTYQHLHASPTLHQLFRCKRSVTVERLQEGKLDLTVLTCIFLDLFLGLIRSAEFFLFSTPNPNTRVPGLGWVASDHPGCPGPSEKVSDHPGCPGSWTPGCPVLARVPGVFTPGSPVPNGQIWGRGYKNPLFFLLPL